MRLDEITDDVFKEKTPQDKAVDALTSFPEKKKGEQFSTTDTRTELTEQQCCDHAILMVMHGAIENPAHFRTHSIIGDLVENKERKLVSKDRKSRQEIVEVARSRDNISNIGMPPMGFAEKLMMPRR